MLHYSIEIRATKRKSTRPSSRVFFNDVTSTSFFLSRKIFRFVARVEKIEIQKMRREILIINNKHTRGKWKLR
jgi:hypothetical protein